MSKLNVDQKTIHELFSDKRADFLIPDYQRPYAWNEEQCQTLWDDIFMFAFPNNNVDSFDDRKDEYFLGAIVTYKNENEQSEIIDGQQRLTTLMLLLRAFYDRFAKMQDPNSIATRARIESCIWKTNAFGEAQKDALKIDSEVATDDDKEEFLELLRTGQIKSNSKSRYVRNYQFFDKKIEEFLAEFPSYFAYLPARILGNCILLPIEADSQDTALRIFSTLNDRGLPLSDADIFKAQFYKFYGAQGKKKDFITRWRALEEITNEIFSPISGTPMDELFTRYMYYLRAKEGIKSSTTEALRKFYERNKYQYLYKEQTLVDLEQLAEFWKKVGAQDEELFSQKVLKQLYVLNNAPNGMWNHLVSAYFLTNKDSENHLEEDALSAFLSKITAFIYAFAITNPGVNALRTPAYEELINVVNRDAVTFRRKLPANTRSMFENYVFTNQRSATRSLLTWYAFTFENQMLPDINEKFQIEHIYAKKRQDMEKTLSQPNNIELLGNKVLLEASINIAATDYRFEDKKKIYSGEMRRGANKKESQITEIHLLANEPQFGESEILQRNERILDAFFEFLRNEELLE